MGRRVPAATLRGGALFADFQPVRRRFARRGFTAPAAGGMSPVSFGSSNAVVSGATLTLVPTVGVAAGALALIAIGFSGALGVGVSTVTDTKGNVWQVTPVFDTGSSTGASSALAYSTLAAGLTTGDTITLTLAGAVTFRAMIGASVAGAAGALDGTAGAGSAGVAGTAVGSGNITTTDAGDVEVGMVVYNAGAADFTPAALAPGWALIDGFVFGSKTIAFYHREPGVTEARAFAGTFGAAHLWSALVAGVAPAGGAPVPAMVAPVAASAVAGGAVAVTAAPLVAPAAAGGVAGGSVAVTAPVLVSGAAGAVSGAAAAVTAATRVSPAAGAAVAGGAASVVAPAGVAPAPGAGSSGGAAAVGAPVAVLPNTATAAGSGAAAVGVPVGVSPAVGAAVSSAGGFVTAPALAQLVAGAAVAAGVMAAVARVSVVESFTDPAGTLLSAHVGESGGWTVHPASAGDGVITAAGRLRQNGASVIGLLSVGGPQASAEYDVEADFVPQATIGGALSGITARLDPAANTLYLARYSGSAGAWQLLKIVNGAATTLVSSAAFPVVAGQSYRVRLQVRDAAKTLFVDGAQVASTADNAIAAPGRAGVRLFDSSVNSDATSVHLDNVRVVDAAASPALTVRALVSGVAAASSGGSATVTAPAGLAPAAGSAAGGGGAAVAAASRISPAPAGASANGTAAITAKPLVQLAPAGANSAAFADISAPLRVAPLPGVATSGAQGFVAAVPLMTLGSGAAGSAGAATVRAPAGVLAAPAGATSSGAAQVGATPRVVAQGGAVAGGVAGATTPTLVQLVPAVATSTAAAVFDSTGVAWLSLAGAVATSGGAVSVSSPVKLSPAPAGGSSTSAGAVGVPVLISGTASATAGGAMVTVVGVRLSLAGAAVSSAAAVVTTAQTSFEGATAGRLAAGAVGGRAAAEGPDRGRLQTARPGSLVR